MSRPTGCAEDDNDRGERAGMIRSIAKPAVELSTIEKVRQVAKSHQTNRVNGILLDAFTAQLIAQLHNALSPANKKTLEEMNIERMADTALRIANKKK